MDKKERIAHFRSIGFTYKQIGELVGLSQQRVYQIHNQTKDPSSVERLKERIRFRDNYECQFCFSKKDIEVHHLDRNKKNNVEKNLMTLCRKCHRDLHQKNGSFS